MKQIIILLSLLIAIGVQAQGVLKGTVIDAKTGEPVPFANVTVHKDGKQVHGDTTDFDGIFTIKPLETDTYYIEIKAVGYTNYVHEGVRVKPEGFTVVEVQLSPIYETITVISEYYGRKDGAMLAPLEEYKIVSNELKHLLDRVINGKCSTYDHEVPRHRIKRGEMCNLYLFSAEKIDTLWHEEDGYNYLYMLYREDSTLPLPIARHAPQFSFDSVTVFVRVTTTYYPDAFDQAKGFVKYRGRIFFIVYTVEDLGLTERRDGKKELFKYREIPTWAHYDPPTWIYTKQQGYWYRWMELPNGY